MSHFQGQVMKIFQGQDSVRQNNGHCKHENFTESSDRFLQCQALNLAPTLLYSNNLSASTELSSKALEQIPTEMIWGLLPATLIKMEEQHKNPA